MVPSAGMWHILGVRSGRAQQGGEEVCGCLAQVISVCLFSLLSYYGTRVNHFSSSCARYGTTGFL